MNDKAHRYVEIQPGDLVQVAPRIGIRSIRRELFDGVGRPRKLLVVEVSDDRQHVSVMLLGSLRLYPTEWLVRCDRVGIGQWR